MMFFREKFTEPNPKNYGLRSGVYGAVALTAGAMSYGLGAFGVAAATQVGAVSVIDAIVTGGFYILPALGMAGGSVASAVASVKNAGKIEHVEVASQWAAKATDRVLDAKDNVAFRISDMAFDLKHQFAKATRPEFREARRQEKQIEKQKATKQKAHKKMAKKAVKEAIKSADKQTKAILKAQKKSHKR